MRWVEIKVWRNVINVLLGIRVKVGVSAISRFEMGITLGGVRLQSQEFLGGHYMRIERMGEAHVDFFLIQE